MRPRCFLAQFSDRPCDGVLRKVHLIPQRVITRELRPPNAKEMLALVWDERVWRWACGGPMGNAGHHGMLDWARTLRIPRHAIPAETEQFAAEHGLEWWLTREYGERA
jgi:uncharacterized protein (DUF2236 family)